MQAISFYKKRILYVEIKSSYFFFFKIYRMISSLPSNAFKIACLVQLIIELFIRIFIKVVIDTNMIIMIIMTYYL